MPRAVEMISLLLGYLNSMCNPILYGLRNSTFKKGLRDLYARCLPKRIRPSNTSQQESYQMSSTSNKTVFIVVISMGISTLDELMESLSSGRFVSGPNPIKKCNHGSFEIFKPVCRRIKVHFFVSSVYGFKGVSPKGTLELRRWGNDNNTVIIFGTYRRILVYVGSLWSKHYHKLSKIL